MNTRRFFSRVGMAFFVLAIVEIFAPLALQLLIDALAPRLIYGYSAVYWLISFVPEYAIGMPLCALILRRLPAMRLYENRLNATGWMTLLCITEFLMMVGNIIGRVLTAIIGNNSNLSMDYGLEDMLMGSSLWIIFIFVVIVGPIMEELVFRKLLIDRAIVFGDLTAILLSAGIFGLMHGNLYQLFYAFAIGCVFGYIYIRTGKIRYTIGLHIVVNFLGSFLPMLLLRMMGYLSWADGSTDQMLSGMINHIGSLIGYVLYLLLELGLVVAGLVLFIINVKKTVLKRGEYTMPAGKTARAVLLNAGMIIFLVVVVIVFILNMI